VWGRDQRQKRYKPVKTHSAATEASANSAIDNDNANYVSYKAQVIDIGSDYGSSFWLDVATQCNAEYKLLTEQSAKRRFLLLV
jgi:hypothetical protein